MIYLFNFKTLVGFFKVRVWHCICRLEHLCSVQIVHGLSGPWLIPVNNNFINTSEFVSFKILKSHILYLENKNQLKVTGKREIREVSAIQPCSPVSVDTFLLFEISLQRITKRLTRGKIKKREVRIRNNSVKNTLNFIMGVNCIFSKCLNNM